MTLEMPLNAASLIHPELALARFGAVFALAYTRFHSSLCRIL